MSKDPDKPVETLTNLGAKSALALKTVGIKTVGELEEIGVVQAFLRLRQGGFRPSMNFLWSMAAGLAGVHHTELPQQVKDILSKQLEDEIQRQEGAQIPLDGLNDHMDDG